MSFQALAGPPAISMGRLPTGAGGYGGDLHSRLSEIVSGLTPELTDLIEHAASKLNQDVHATIQSDRDRNALTRAPSKVSAADKSRQESPETKFMNALLGKILEDGEISPEELALLLKLLGLDGAAGTDAPDSPPASSSPPGGYASGGSSGGGRSSGGASDGRSSGGGAPGGRSSGSAGGPVGSNRSGSEQSFKHSIATPDGRTISGSGPSSGTGGTGGTGGATGPGTPPVPGGAGAGANGNVTPPTDPKNAAGVATTGANVAPSTDAAFNSIGGPTSSVMLGNTKVTVEGGTPAEQSKTTGVMKEMYDKNPAFKQGIDSKAATGVTVKLRDLEGNTAGYATIGGNQIALDPEHMRPGVFGHTVAHEVAHNLGMQHGAALDAFADQASATVS